MKDYCGYVNVFQGCDEIDLPRPEGVAAAWRFIKGRCGNNTPAAALPFGRITAGCYSGGYSSGYGRLMYNTHGEIEKLWPQNMFRGLSHLQNDGTGDIDTFYNYAVVSPFEGSLASAADPRALSDERAEPGYYACRDSRTGALCETTVTPRAALHRIRFPRGGGRMSIDFSNDGLYDDGGHLRSPAGRATLRLVSGGVVEVSAELHHLTVHFCLRVEGARGLRLWVDDAERDERTLELEAGHSFGVVFDAAGEADLTLGLSPRSADIARRDALENTLSFDEAKGAARAAWNEALSRVDARFDDERDYEIFYSNLYHSLMKPCDFSGESFLYDGNEFVLEFATIWDQYKTALPLIYTLYPDMARKIVNTMLNVAEATKKMPHTLMMCGDYEALTTTQARMLAEHSIVD
ncbi:MAG: glycoside hydrolase family 92 protein, partial [Clostridia bacterium]|nr:glycoside hydrolase family 92 protein [Clostridia bacterium]